MTTWRISTGTQSNKIRKGNKLQLPEDSFQTLFNRPLLCITKIIWKMPVRTRCWIFLKCYKTNQMLKCWKASKKSHCNMVGWIGRLTPSREIENRKIILMWVDQCCFLGSIQLKSDQLIRFWLINLVFMILIYLSFLFLPIQLKSDWSITFKQINLFSWFLSISSSIFLSIEQMKIRARLFSIL